MSDLEKFALPCIGCGTEAGESRVVIRIDSQVYFTNPLTAKMLATDLLLWADHVEKLNEEREAHEETQEQPERGNAELLESIIKGCKELNIQMETMFPHDADQAPMPEEEALKLILGERSSLLELVRQVEQYHGIGTEPKEDQCD